MTRTPAEPLDPSTRPARRRSRHTALAVAAATALVTVGFLTGCTAPDSGTGGGSAPAGSSLTPSTPGVPPLGAGFLGANTSPTPEATINPEHGSWDGVVPPEGYKVVLISAGDDASATTLAAAVSGWAARENVDFQVMAAADDDAVEDRINDAVALEPDLIVGTGDGVVDVFALITTQHLAQKFLVVGSELPEPTENVTSVIWPGAAFRGTGLGTSGDQDASTFTPQRADEAISAGVASVLHGITGIVVNLPA